VRESSSRIDALVRQLNAAEERERQAVKASNFDRQAKEEARKTLRDLNEEISSLENRIQSMQVRIGHTVHRYKYFAFFAGRNRRGIFPKWLVDRTSAAMRPF